MTIKPKNSFTVFLIYLIVSLSFTLPVTFAHTYDHTGNRVMKSEPLKNQTTYYVSKYFIHVVNSSGTFNTTYVYDEKDLVARKDPDGKKYFYHPDHLGSTSLITNSTGSVVEETTYEPFGKVASGGSDRFLYTGKELDTGTGLEYYGARYYDPSKASQFVQPDSVIADPYNPQNLNRYSYVLNNPYKYVDESGNVPVLVVAFILFNVAMTAWDAYDFANDPNLVTGGALALGVLPGDEFAKGVKRVEQAAKWVGDIGGLAKGTDKAVDVAKTAENLKSFTSRNFRENLGTLTGKPLAELEEAHHVFPQAKELATKFEKAGINIHDPKFGAIVNKQSHRDFSYDYNKNWEKFFADKPQATKEDILQKGRELSEKYGFTVNY